MNQGEKRFKNFVLMIGDEVVHEMQKDFINIESDLKDDIKDPTIVSLMKIAVVKTMVNLQTKNAYTKPFMAQLIGKKTMDKLEE